MNSYGNINKWTWKHQTGFPVLDASACNNARSKRDLMLKSEKCMRSRKNSWNEALVVEGRSSQFTSRLMCLGSILHTSSGWQSTSRQDLRKFLVANQVKSVPSLPYFGPYKPFNPSADRRLLGWGGNNEGWFAPFCVECSDWWKFVKICQIFSWPCVRGVALLGLLFFLNESRVSMIAYTVY